MSTGWSERLSEKYTLEELRSMRVHVLAEVEEGRFLDAYLTAIEGAIEIVEGRNDIG